MVEQLILMENLFCGKEYGSVYQWLGYKNGKGHYWMRDGIFMGSNARDIFCSHHYTFIVSDDEECIC